MKAARLRSSSLPAWIAVAAVIVWLAATAGIRPLASPDEGRYIGVAYEMLRSGDWMVPRLNGLPFFHKPPLFYWISAASMAVLGPSEWPARLPSVLGATCGALSLFFFLRRWAAAEIASMSALILVTMPFFYIGAQFANLDMLVAGCIAATVLLAANAALLKELGLPWRVALAGAFLFAALGVLAKGLIGIVVPGFVFVVWCLATRRFRAIGLMAWPPGWIALLAVAGPWFVSMQLRYPEFFDYFIVTQHFRRFAAAGFNNEHPFWFYLPVIAVLTLPWVAWGAWLAATRLSFRSARLRLSDVDWLMVAWCAGVVVFFSLPRSKLIGYVLPALPPLAYLLARAALRIAGGSGEGGAPSRPARWTAGLAAGLCIVCVAALSLRATQPGILLQVPAGLPVLQGDQVAMLDAYYYGLPFHWALQKPVIVLGNWTPGGASQRDDWRKELYDAGQFDRTRASALLVDMVRVQSALCVPSPTWVIGPSHAQLVHPWLEQLKLVASDSEAAIWRYEGSPARDGHCLGMPQADSPRSAPS